MVSVDTSLSGLLIGYSLATKPEEVYRALLESTAFGTRVIVDAFDDAGVQVLELYACGGLPKKNPTRGIDVGAKREIYELMNLWNRTCRPYELVIS